jgi:single-strand selective monofunctional uracil DNA glycosylase
MPALSIVDELVRAARQLRAAAHGLNFTAPVTCVYNPLDYAWPAHETYLRRFGQRRKRVVFLGMNPGPFGMAQTGVPFGEVAAVRDWLGIRARIGKPPFEHPRRPIEGFACPRSEVSGLRLWGLFARRFRTAEKFFQAHFVANYCPLSFLEKSGRNVTPDKLPARQAAPLYAACDEHLRRVIRVLQPEWLIGIGGFAERRARLLFANSGLKLGKILHPSPASPVANRDWAGQATRQLQGLGVWERQ